MNGLKKETRRNLNGQILHQETGKMDAVGAKVVDIWMDMGVQHPSLMGYRCLVEHRCFQTGHPVEDHPCPRVGAITHDLPELIVATDLGWKSIS